MKSKTNRKWDIFTWNCNITWKWGLETHFAICLNKGSWILTNCAGSMTSRISSISPKNITCKKRSIILLFLYENTVKKFIIIHLQKYIFNFYFCLLYFSNSSHVFNFCISFADIAEWKTKKRPEKLQPSQKGYFFRVPSLFLVSNYVILWPRPTEGNSKGLILKIKQCKCVYLVLGYYKL